MSTQPGYGDAPKLSADLNGVRSAATCAGWPMLLRVRLTHPQLFDADASPIVLASEGGNWADQLRIEVRDGSGAPVSWPLTMLNAPSGSLLLDGTHLGELYWALSPAQTASIAPGDYTLRAIWDSLTVNLPEAWTGFAQAVPVEVSLQPEPGALSASERERKHRCFAEYDLALGDTTAALGEMDTLLQSDPGNIGGLSLRGMILREMGRYQEALESTRLALNQIASRYPDAEEPPRDLLTQRFELTQLLLPGRLNSVTATNSGVVLDWNAVTGELHNVESSRDLTNWTTKATALPADADRLIWSTELDADHEFFRIGR